MLHKPIFDATLLQVFEDDSKACNIVTRILLELLRVTHPPLTFNAKSSHNEPRRTEISHVDSHVNSVGHICRPGFVKQEPGLTCCEHRYVKNRKDVSCNVN